MAVDEHRSGMQPNPEVVPAAGTKIPPRPNRLKSAFLWVRLHGMIGFWRLFNLRLYFSFKTCFSLRVDLLDWEFHDLAIPPELRIEQGRLEDLQQFRDRMGKSTLPDDFLVDQYLGLRKFYLGFWEGEIAHILWIARSVERTSVPNLRLNKDAVEFRNIHTMERFRRRKIFSHVLRTALRDLQMAGVETGFAHVNENNFASLSGFKNAGFLPMERVFILRLFGFRQIWAKPIDIKNPQ
jgi:ribosomal protein S18 acetylase RimI-like enzyme